MSRRLRSLILLMVIGVIQTMPDQELFTTEGLSAIVWLKTIENQGNNVSVPVMVYPNPVRDFVQISGLGDQCYVEVFNQQGLRMASFTIGNQDGIVKLDVSKYQPGVYKLRINDKTGMLVRKFVKM